MSVTKETLDSRNLERREKYKISAPPQRRDSAARPRIVSVVGLTASGKSDLGVILAKEFNGEIISADSRQVYRGLDLGSGKITPAEMDGVVHHLLDVVDPGEKFDVFIFQRMAYAAIDDILARGKLPIIVGGTGLYSRSVVQGYVFGDNQKSTKSKPRYDVLQICLLPSKEIIRPLVERRIDKRLGQGMLDETKGLLARGVSPDWLRALGLEYYWNTELVLGNITMDEYKQNLTTKIMQFAKRQRTWFKREQNTHFLSDPNSFEPGAQNLVAGFVTPPERSPGPK